MKSTHEERRHPTVSRRSLLKTILAASVAPAFVQSRANASAPSERITLGFIGVGNQGTRRNLGSFLRERDAQAVSVCDVFASRRERARQLVDKAYSTKGCKSVNDFREILADPSIDAVVISTPDHWHVPMSLMALEAGKDVFCEKPTHTIAEGRTLIDAVKKRNAVFQVGLEDRSIDLYHKMIEWIRNGAIGTLEKVEVKLPHGFDYPLEKPAPVPEGLDYDLFVGPAPFKPYTPSCTVQKRWRMNSDYANGSLVDWGSHLVDTAQLGADAPGVCPVEVKGEGVIPTGRATDVPIGFDVRYRYANGVEMVVQSGKVLGAGKGCADIRFTGSKGWVGNQGWRAPLEASDPKILETKYAPKTSKHWQRPPYEHRNFLDCVRSRKATTYTVETMHLLHVTLHMGTIAMRLGRKLRWDPKTEAFLGDEAANKMRSRPSRDDWK